MKAYIRNNLVRPTLVCFLLATAGCESVVQPYVPDTDCPTPEAPFLYPELCQQEIDFPRITRLWFDPPGGKVPLNVRFHAEAQGGIREFDDSTTIHWDVDGDSEADAVTLSGETFYFSYDTCESIRFHVWAEDELGRISEPLPKLLNLSCNQLPFMNEFRASTDKGPPGTEITFFVDAYDIDPREKGLQQGIKFIDWDFDGDGSFDVRTDGSPVIFPYKYVYKSVGIYRPRVRVYDDELRYADSERLQIQILGTRTILQGISTKARADAVVARNGTVASFYGAGITLRHPLGDAMEELAQKYLGNTENKTAANYGNLFFVADAVQGGVWSWLAASATDVTASETNPALLRDCQNTSNLLRIADQPLANLFGRAVHVHSFAAAGSDVTVAVIEEYHNPLLAPQAGRVFLVDLSRAGEIPVTETSGTTCVGGEELMPEPRELYIHEPLGAVRVAQQVTATSEILWAAASLNGVRGMHLPSFWDNTEPLPAGAPSRVAPIVYNEDGGFSSSFRAEVVAARAAATATSVPGSIYTVAATEAVVTMHYPLQAAVPVTLVADGWPVPATAIISRSELALRVHRWAYDAYSLAASSMQVYGDTPEIILVADSVPDAVQLYARPGTAYDLSLLRDAGRKNVLSRGAGGEIRFWRNWIVYWVDGPLAIPAYNGIFMAPVTAPSTGVKVSTFEPTLIRDIDLEGDALYVAVGDKGIYAYDLSAVQDGHVPVVTRDTNLEYSVGDAPSDLLLDDEGNTLWVAENKAGIHRFDVRSDYKLNNARRIPASGNVRGLAADFADRELFAAAGTEVTVFSMDTTQEVGSIGGMSNAICVAYRRDGTKEALAVCDVNPSSGVTTIRARFQDTGPSIWQQVLNNFGGTFGQDSAVFGPLLAPTPRLFVGADNAVSVYCLSAGNGDCDAQDIDILPDVGGKPNAAVYRSIDQDLLVVGAQNAQLTFWDFTNLPVNIGTVRLCDSQELWLPVSVCQSGSQANLNDVVHVNDMAVVAQYAFLATSWGVFAIDLRAAPILRVGSFDLGYNAKTIAAAHIGADKYAVYVGTDSGIAAVRFEQFEEPE